MTSFNLGDYPHAIAGDLVFVRGAKRGLVERYQRAHRMPHPEKSHVACVVSPVDMMEAMWRKTSYSLVFSEWLRTRKKSDKFYILRHPNASVEKTSDVIEAALFYLEEVYALDDALRNAPESVGKSICSVTAAKILRRAGLIEPQLLPMNQQIYPGPLYSMLLNLGWIELEMTDQYFANGVVPESHSPMQTRIKTMKAARYMRSMTAQTDGLIATMDTFFAKAEAKDVFWALAASRDSSALQYLADQISDVVLNHCRVLTRAEKGSVNWKETDESQNQIRELIKLTEEKQAIIFDLLQRIGDEVKACFNMEEFLEGMKRVKAALASSGIVSENDARRMLNSYLQAEVSFLAVTGSLAKDFILPPITLPRLQIEQLNTKDREHINEVGRVLESYYESVGNQIEGQADQIGIARQVLGVIFEDSSMQNIDELVSSKMSAMLFDGIRGTPGFENAQKFRAMFDQSPTN